MSLFPDVWGGGQLLAFSALDGTTDYNNGLVLRTAFDGYALEVKQPEVAGRIRYTGPSPERIELTGDWLAI